MKLDRSPLQIIAIPAFSDNYIWLIHDHQNAIVIDPGDAQPVLAFLNQHPLKLVAILITHHHADHIGGVLALRNTAPNIPIYGALAEQQNGRISMITQGCIDRQMLFIDALNLQIEVLEVAGHTRTHLAFYCPQLSALFCGDTLFAGGCGRLFEGTPAQMLASLQKIAALPNDTNLFCAHEYTLSNLKFATVIEPNNAALTNRLKTVTEQRAQDIATVPSTLQIELETNPFLRTSNAEVVQTLLDAERLDADKKNDDVAVFAALRKWKNDKTDLQKIIKNCNCNYDNVVFEYIDCLLLKINHIEKKYTKSGFDKFIRQLKESKDQGDFKGRVLELNFVDLFLKKDIHLQYETKQGMSGYIDFSFEIQNLKIFIEMKLLQIDQKNKSKLETSEIFKINVNDDTADIRRIQRDIFLKSRKFNPIPKLNWINLIAIDVSELQLKTIDFVDCLLAAEGNNAVIKNKLADFYCRPGVVGLFEQISNPTEKQQEWINFQNTLLEDKGHPRDYIHGIIFLFRNPIESAALSYDLTSYLIFNPILDNEKAKLISHTLNNIINPRK